MSKNLTIINHKKYTLKYWHLEGLIFKGVLIRDKDIIGSYSGKIELFDELTKDLRKNPLTKTKVYISKKKPFEYDYMFSDLEQFKKYMFGRIIPFIEKKRMEGKMIEKIHYFNSDFIPLFNMYVEKYGYFAFREYKYYPSFHTDLTI